MDRLSRVTDALPGNEADLIERLASDLAQRTCADAAWTLHLLGGATALRPALSPAVLRAAALKASGLPEWLFDTCRQAVGDLAETIALTMPVDATDRSTPTDMPTNTPTPSAWITQVLVPLRETSVQQGPDAAAAALAQAWRTLDGRTRELGIRLACGRWRTGLPVEILQAAVALLADLPPSVVAQRWAAWLARSSRPRGPDDAGWLALVAPLQAVDARVPDALPSWPVLSRPDLPLTPAPFPVEDWLALQDLAGLRVQLVRERGRTALWSADLRLLDGAFPDLIEATAGWPDGLVIEGELLPRQPGGTLQPRLGKTPASASVCRRAPVWLRLLDLLEEANEDLRTANVATRRMRMQALQVGQTRLQWPTTEPTAFWSLAEEITASDWREAAGLLLLRRGPGSVVDAGPQRWRLPAAPTTARVLLLHAQAGTGRDAGLYTDCTLAVWSRPPLDAAEAEAVIEAIAQQTPRDGPAGGALELLPLARATLGLSKEERLRVDRLVRATTVARHGPVRSLRPGLVLSLAFEEIEANARRRSGVMVREPRVLGLLDEVSPLEASNLPALLAQADQRRTRFGCQ